MNQEKINEILDTALSNGCDFSLTVSNQVLEYIFAHSLDARHYNKSKLSFGNIEQMIIRWQQNRLKTIFVKRIVENSSIIKNRLENEKPEDW